MGVPLGPVKDETTVASAASGQQALRVRSAPIQSDGRVVDVIFVEEAVKLADGRILTVQAMSTSPEDDVFVKELLGILASIVIR
jgi:hypothetical protein